MNVAGRFMSMVFRYWVVLLLATVPAVAQSVNGACLYSLDSTAQQAFYISGNATITTNCSIVVESASSAAFAMGGTDTLYLGNHAQVGVVGGWQLNGQSIIDTISNQQVQPVNISNPGDPLASVPAPTQGTIVSAAPVTYNQSNPPPNNTLSPGVYCGGLSIANTGGVQYTMSPGTYVMAGGGLKITSSAMVAGSGVTVYNTSSNGWGCSGSYSYTPITIDGQAAVNLSAPTSGPLAGIVLFGDRNGCATPGTCQDDVNGKATATFNGVLYFKSDLLLFNGTSSSGGCMAAVADKITINGDTYSGGNSCFLNPISISIAPASVGLYGGQTQQFTATVTNTYFTNVTWSISPAGIGTIDSSGNYTAPALIGTEQTVTVTATSQADTTKSASATVTLFPPMTISISPVTATLYGGQQQTFAATVTNTFNSAVSWSISPAGAGSITASGVYTAPPSIPAQQAVTVTATSQANPSLSASATVTLMPPITVSVSPATATLSGGQTQQFTASVTNTSNQAVTWSIAAGGAGTISASGLYTAPASISAQQTVTVIATSQADPTKSASASVNLSPTYQALTLAAAATPPYVTGTTQAFVATLKNQVGTAQSGVTVTFTVSGVNTTSGSATTDAAGNATFSYTGKNSGTDSVQASASTSAGTVSSNSVSVSWLVPKQDISTTTITGEFFLSDGSGAFDTPPTATPVFTQTFPTINFNPPAGTVPGNTSGVGVNTRPFTDVTTDLNGNYTGTIIAQGNGDQAGVGSLFTFQAVFRGSFTVASAGNVVFNFYSDDGFIFGIGNGATRVSGASSNMPAVTPFAQYPTMGAYNQVTAPVGNQIVVNFPAAGSYPYEIDYTECCSGQEVLTMTQGASSPTGIAPTGSLTISPNSLQPLPVGGQQSFTILASDASGNAVPNTNVSLVVTGVDNIELSGATDSTGHATIIYKDVNPGTASVQAVAFISGMVTYSNQVTVPWTLAASGTSGSGANGSLSVSISAANTVILPASLALSGTATDSGLPQGDTISLAWTEVSGPGTVTFANPQQGSTTASFSEAGIYQLQLAATDVNGTASAQITVAVNPQAGVSQGWIGSPAYGAQVSGIVPITVASGVTLSSGVLTVYPANNPSAVTVLNANTTGSGQIGLWDTTQINNGTYWITLQATTTSGSSEYNLALVTVVGNYKPGRVTTTVTDLVVPANGLPINIQRTYDSLNASTSGDFGYGWNLGTTVNLSVDPKGDVTFTLGGIRHTFYLTPQFLGWLFPYYVPAYTAEAGFHGTLNANGAGCADLFDFLVPDGSLWACIGGGYFNPSSYVYTDPTGTSYLISASGNLQAIVDKNGNRIDISANGITSSTGLSVPFVRDSSGRITSITDPQGNVYQYGYDTSGNLVTVTYPNTPISAAYTYDSNHFYLSGTDFNGNPLPTTDYYTSTDTDTNGLPLNGRLKSVTDGLGETTSYAYNLKTNATTITYPADAGGNVGTATMVYSSAGDLLSSTDPLGHTTTNVYDSNRNLTSVTDPLNYVTCYTYDANGNRTSVTLPQAASCSTIKNSTTYNQYSEPTQTTDEDGNTRSFNYDANFNPLNVTDNLGTLASFQFNANGTMAAGAVGFDISANPSKASQFTYDADGNLASRTDALGRTTSYTYNSLGQKTSMVEPLLPNTSASAATTAFSYDPFGNLTETDAPLGRVTKSQYDGNNNKTQDTDANGNVTKYKYDALNRLILTTYPDGTTDSKSYDFRGNMVQEIDQAGHVTKNVYDLAGRLSSTTHASGTSDATATTYAYDNDGRKLSETDNLGHATTYTYDAPGNLTGISGVNGTFSYEYDNARNRVSMTDGNSHTTGYAYDTRKRLTTTTYPDQTTVTNAYDGPGNLSKVTDQNSHVVEYSYDAANQLVQVMQDSSPNSANITLMGYDSDGNPASLEDANSHTTSSSFNLLGELSSKTLPDGSSIETRGYDTAGNLKTLTHFNGVTTTYNYDNLNRVLSRTTPGEATVSFTYTATGMRQTMADASGTTTYTYDNMDRLLTKATPEGTLSYTYDGAGHLASMQSSNSNGANVSYTYDTLNRLHTVVDSHLGTTTYSYDGANNVASVAYPNGVQTAFTYDDLNRVKAAATQTVGYSYMRDPAGKITNALELDNRSITWNYDGINRLQSESIVNDPSGENGQVNYILDPVGNRSSATSSISGLTPVGGTFNPNDELGSETYDQNGNVTSTGGKSFTYNSQNQLVSMGSTVGLVYDGDGNRVAKTANGTTTRYLVDDLNPTGYPQVVDELTNGVVTRTYAYGLQRISQDQVVSNSWTPSFYIYDGGGSVRALTNAAGAATDAYKYDAFGNLLNKTGSTPNSYLYRSEFFDSDLGLYYLRARWMNPLTGRLMSRDPEDGMPADPRTLHRYLYAFGDPVNRIDPRGRASILETGSLDEVIGTTPVPALVELGGGAYASAASWATDQYFLYAASTSNVVEAVSDFIEGVDWIELTSGLTKAFLCIKAEDFLFDQLERRLLDFEGDHPDTWLEQKAKDKFEEVCWVLAGKAL